MPKVTQHRVAEFIKISACPASWLRAWTMVVEGVMWILGPVTLRKDVGMMSRGGW